MDPRAVHLGSLFVRGLSYLIAANSACGFPFAMNELMPWKIFDGLLFHSKYLQAHTDCAKEELLEGNVSREKLLMNIDVKCVIRCEAEMQYIILFTSALRLLDLAACIQK